jgi:hypothetical protein
MKEITLSIISNPSICLPTNKTRTDFLIPISKYHNIQNTINPSIEQVIQRDWLDSLIDRNFFKGSLFNWENIDELYYS